MLLNPDRHWWLMPSSMALAFIWQFWPIGQTLRLYAPDAVVMVMLYWALRKPQHVSSGWALTVGLLIDSIGGSLLGMHALALVVIVYFIQQMEERLRMFAIWQQSLVIGVLYAGYLMICHWVLMLDPRQSDKPILLIQAVSTGLCWPVCYLLLRWLEQGSARRSVRA